MRAPRIILFSANESCGRGARLCAQAVDAAKGDRVGAPLVGALVQVANGTHEGCPYLRRCTVEHGHPNQRVGK